VAEQDKKYRPLFEALMAKTDGLDILAEITGEKKAPEERKEAAAPAPTDTFSGMLQTLPMLIMLPAIMPLLQQTLTQTLSSTTVNVKVESATAIVPIDISASTAIVPIEIKASTVTLNVNITGSNVTLNVNISNVESGVTFNVNVSGDVNIIIKSQTSGVYLGDTWLTLSGYDVDLTMFTRLQPFEKAQVAIWNPASGEIYLIEAISASYIVPKDSVMRPELVVFEVYAGSDVVATLNVTREKPTDFVNIMRTISITSSQPLSIYATNYSPMPIRVRGTVFMYKAK
jgi:hypothetical protein